MSPSAPARKNASSRVVTFGCRLNFYESGLIADHLKNSHTAKPQIVVNTCAVTKEAERQAQQAIRRLHRENPDAEILVTGCAAQLDPQKFHQMPEVGRVLGNAEKVDPASFMDPTERVHVRDIQTVSDLSPHLASGFETSVRAFLQIQNGCNHRCTFCIIPFARGPNRSVPLGFLVDQIQKFLSKGVKEIVLTGVDITDYGHNLPGNPNLTTLLKRLLKALPELNRLRLSSLDPAELEDDFFEFLQGEPRIMPHFHISLQAGDDLILKRMKRRHLRHHIIDFCEKIRHVRPESVLGADVISGFPTETEEHFQNTYDLLKTCDIPLLHVFPYSVRPGTPAARMPQVPKPLIKERAKRLRSLGDTLLRKTLQRHIGRPSAILMETAHRGHTDTFLPVLVTSPQTPGNILMQAPTEIHFDGHHRPVLYVAPPSLGGSC
jgi:threonylcarbamoyladenosine tRNA methylthiotransferase MtaB